MYLCQGAKIISGGGIQASSSNVGKSTRQEIRDPRVKGTSVIMGDFNLHIDWESQISHSTIEEEFLKCIGL